MEKNRFLGLIIIGLFVVVGIIYAVWIFFFNKGQVIFEGIPPFNVSIGGNNYACLEQQCLYDLGAREYSYTISKDGYIDQSGSVRIERGKITVVSYDTAFEAKPLSGVDYPMLSLPVGYSKFEEKLLDISLFHMIQDGYELSRMPKKLNDISFAPSGGAAILFEDTGVSYYKTDTFTSRDLDMLQDAYAVGWSDDEVSVYSVVYDDASKKDALIKVNLSDQSFEKLVYFNRNVDEYSLSVSPDERYIVLSDLTSDTQIVYFIDLQEASRTNVFEGHAIEEGEWSRESDYYLFKGKKEADGVSGMWMIGAGNKAVEPLVFNCSSLLLTSAPGANFYFVSTENYSLSGSTRPYFSAFDTSENEMTVDELIESESISLHMFNVDERQTYLILELNGVIPDVPEKVEANEEGVIVRMLVGDQYFDVKVGE